MKGWSALVVLIIFAGALLFRLPQLDSRPLHNDEAVNAIKLVELWQEGHYRYDPDEYHGPTLHYATAPFLGLSGASTTSEVQDKTLRLATVAFGAALVLLLLLFWDGLGRSGTIWSALFIAISPAMVFYSRYFIHEMLLVFFTALTIGAGWRYCQNRSCVWAIICGTGLGLMFATKETFVLTVAAMLIALVVTAWSTVHARRSWESLVEFIPWRDVAIGSLAVLAVWLLFFSSFLTNSRGLLDSVLTYLPWLKRAAGDSPHIHPWYFYFQRLGWFHPVRGPVWSEALILVLAVVGMIGSFLPGRPLLIRFLTIYSIVLATIYSIISYKTPWCLLNFYLGLLLLAGVGGAFLIELVRKKIAQLTIVALLLAGTVQLTIQSWRASYLFAADRRNPYVYAQTVPDILNLVERVNGIAEVSTNGFETVVKVIAPESDYWPLPWYLRRFEHVGWYSELPADPFAPIIIVSSDLDARLDDKSDRKWIMAGMTELRPTKFLELYVELELWKKYVEALQPPPEE